MKLNDIPHAAWLKAELEKYKTVALTKEMFLGITISATADPALIQEWFEDEGPSEIIASIGKWLKDKRTEKKAQLAALDLGIAEDIASLSD